jgi:hypothetical protein
VIVVAFNVVNTPELAVLPPIGPGDDIIDLIFAGTRYLFEIDFVDAS